MTSDPRLTQRYSKIQVSDFSHSQHISSPPQHTLQNNSSSIPVGPTLSRHIIRPIQFLFEPKTYSLGWLISLGVALAFFCTLALLRQTSVTQLITIELSGVQKIFYLWSSFFLSQWGIHLVLLHMRGRSVFENQVFTSTTLKSQWAFLGLINFCLTAFLVLLLYLGAQLW